MKKYFLIFSLFIFIALPSQAQTKDISGYEIMEKVFEREDGKDNYARAEMVLIDKKGNQRERLLEIYTKDYGDLIKTFLRFTSPADIEDTAFLSMENEEKDDTQYLYLPALGRERRIVSSQKNLQFVNTDSTYEDMQRRHPDKDRHVLLKEEIFQNTVCYVIESVPREKKNSQYTKRLHWVDKEKMIILKTDFYGKKFRKIKEFAVNKVEKRQGIWTVMESVMHSLKDQHKTLVKIMEIHYNQALSDHIFTIRHFK